MSKLEPKELHFIRHDIKDQGSLILFLEQGDSPVGIYWIDFEDGHSYVGQSVAVRSRLATHRRRWSDAETVRFAPCSRERLDEFELATIQLVQKTRPLRNKLLTNRPGGEADLVVTVTDGKSLALPWRREERGAIAGKSPDTQPTTAQVAKYAQMQRIHGAEQALSITAKLISQCFPSPVQTQSLLWSVSALPATNRQSGWHRFLTLSAGRLEILRIFESVPSGPELNFSVLNIAPDPTSDDPAGAFRKGSSRSLRRAGLKKGALYSADYRVLTGVYGIDVPNLDTLSRLIDEEFIREAVYRLVITMMRQGSAPLARHHNWPLAERLLKEAASSKLNT